MLACRWSDRQDRCSEAAYLGEGALRGVKALRHMYMSSRERSRLRSMTSANKSTMPLLAVGLEAFTCQPVPVS